MTDRFRRERGTVVVVAPPTLSPAELARAESWRGRWGAVHWTREPREGRTLLRIEAVGVPLVEIAGRATYCRLVFQRWLTDHGDRHLLRDAPAALVTLAVVGSWMWWPR